MNPVSKTYRPKERLCAYCGGIVICRDAANWGFKCRDYRPGPPQKKFLTYRDYSGMIKKLPIRDYPNKYYTKVVGR